MPIKPENRSRYPADWRQIVAKVRERSGDRCEGSPAFPHCRAANGLPHPETGSRVVLTTGHLGLPGFVPVDLSMTGSAQADQVVDLVGVLVPFQSELPEWTHMMHGRLLAELRSGGTASATRFVVALPRGFPSGGPGCAIAGSAATVSPEYAVLTGWRLFREPWDSASVSAESATGCNVPAADSEWHPAGNTNPLAQASLNSTQVLIATGRRARFDEVRRLLGSQREHFVADDADLIAPASSWGASNSRALDPATQRRIECAGARIRARFPGGSWAVSEAQGANRARHRRGTLPWSSHAASLLAFGDFPENCDLQNLRHWCQRCHLVYDAKHHAQTAYATRKASAGTMELF